MRSTASRTWCSYWWAVALWFPTRYTALAATSFAAALAYWWYERHTRVAELSAALASEGAFRWRDVLHFSPAYWSLVALCVLWCAGILAFRSTFAIKYFQHVFGLPLDEAGQMNSVMFLTSIVSTPLLGWLCDRTGRYSAILVCGSFLLPAAFLWLHFVGADPHVGMVLIGMSYSLVGAAHPEGYGAMMLFFLACSSLGFIATLLLWQLVPGRIGDRSAA